MRKIEIVTHCWRYSRMLAYQLSSLVHHPAKTCHVQITIHACQDVEEDLGTHEILCQPWLPAFARPKSGEIEAFALTIQRVTWPVEQLLNRNIGRNHSALKTSADWVWFADCDYYFGEGCLDALAAIEPRPDDPLVYPDPYWISRDHATGERYIREPRQIDPADFVPHTCNRAIGGVQIIPGSVCRRVGYAAKSLKPFTADAEFGGFSGDVEQRRLLGTAGRKIQLPNLYRLREHRGQVDSLIA